MAYGMGGANYAGGYKDLAAGTRKRSALDNINSVYGTSIEKQAGDYDQIMQNYRDIYAKAMDPSNYQFTPYQAAQTRYEKSADTTRALAELSDLASTGGISARDEQNLRARGISPIRAMYATANRDMNRQRRLAGGYSANFGAVTAKMTRDQSSQIADQMDKVNANIAQMRQSGRLSAAPNYASAAQAESALKHGIASENTQASNEASRFNATGQFESQRQRRSDALGAAHGMTNLYGTTPALSNLYGTQALNQAKFGADEDQRKKSNAISALGSMYRA